MADFRVAMRRMLKIEGSYANHPQDRGGETICGIARKYHPEWRGWVLVDEVKRKNLGKFSDFGVSDALRTAVWEFYRPEYWDKIWGDQIPEQAVAEELFEMAVNLGVKKAVEILQQALNVLNRNGKLYSDIMVDGIMGKQTLARLAICVQIRGVQVLLNMMNVMQGMHYVSILLRDPTQEEFAVGWLKRIEIRKI